MEGRQEAAPAERDIIEQLGCLRQEAQYRLQPSVQSAPQNYAHRKHCQRTDQLERSLAHEAVQSSSDAPTDTISHLPAIRTSAPVPALKQVPFMLDPDVIQSASHERQCLAFMGKSCGYLSLVRETLKHHANDVQPP